MGVQRLQTYLRKNYIGKRKQLDYLEGKNILIDGDSVTFYLYETSASTTLYGGEFLELSRYIENYLREFRKRYINITVVFDGIPPDEKRNTILERRRAKKSRHDMWWSCLRNEDVYHGHRGEIPVQYPGLVRATFLEQLKRNNIHVIHASGENDDEIVRLLHTREYDAVIAKDTDFVIYDIAMYIPINYVNFEKNNFLYINREDVSNSLGIKPWQLSLMSCLAGNDITHGNKESRKFLTELHNDMRPHIIKNIGRWISESFEDIMELMTLNTNLFDMYALTCKKYSMKFESKVMNKLNDVRRRQFKNCMLNTDAVVLLTKKVRYFQKIPTQTRQTLTLNMRYIRSRIYGLVCNEDHPIEEKYWVNDETFNEQNRVFIHPLPVPFFQDTIERIAYVFNIPYNFLMTLPDTYKIVCIAIKIITDSNVFAKEENAILIKNVLLHHSLMDVYSNETLEGIQDTSVPIDPSILEILDLYVCCLQETMFTNQLVGTPINVTTVNYLYSGLLMYTVFTNPNIPRNYSIHSVNIARKICDMDCTYWDISSGDTKREPIRPPPGFEPLKNEWTVVTRSRKNSDKKN